MATLHILNKAPAEAGVANDCFRSISQGDGLALIEDGVYHALSAQPSLMNKECQIFALQPDLEARGLSSRIESGTQVVNQAGFVDLCCQFEKSISWF